eukprot:TRINITY_DN1605_c0_g2_i2.p1 TRINITY_DN1605_c0_g2~~TRINITY_DN1605_c0_g2_i2.p1  ORF type:complete len:1727 (-),score=251.07 TRINITY_DN1605_c0_g2_i2:183-5363(-)
MAGESEAHLGQRRQSQGLHPGDNISRRLLYENDDISDSMERLGASLPVAPIPGTVVFESKSGYLHPVSDTERGPELLRHASQPSVRHDVHLSGRDSPISPLSARMRPIAQSVKNGRSPLRGKSATGSTREARIDEMVQRMEEIQHQAQVTRTSGDSLNTLARRLSVGKKSDAGSERALSRESSQGSLSGQESRASSAYTAFSAHTAHTVTTTNTGILAAPAIVTPGTPLTGTPVLQSHGPRLAMLFKRDSTFDSTSPSPLSGRSGGLSSLHRGEAPRDVKGNLRRVSVSERRQSLVVMDGNDSKPSGLRRPTLEQMGASLASPASLKKSSGSPIQLNRSTPNLGEGEKSFKNLENAQRSQAGGVVHTGRSLHTAGGVREDTDKATTAGSPSVIDTRSDIETKAIVQKMLEANDRRRKLVVPIEQMYGPKGLHVPTNNEDSSKKKSSHDRSNLMRDLKDVGSHKYSLKALQEPVDPFSHVFGHGGSRSKVSRTRRLKRAYHGLAASQLTELGERVSIVGFGVLLSQLFLLALAAIIAEPLGYRILELPLINFTLFLDHADAVSVFTYLITGMYLVLGGFYAWIGGRMYLGFPVGGSRWSENTLIVLSKFAASVMHIPICSVLAHVMFHSLDVFSVGFRIYFLGLFTLHIINFVLTLVVGLPTQSVLPGSRLHDAFQGHVMVIIVMSFFQSVTVIAMSTHAGGEILLYIVLPFHLLILALHWSFQQLTRFMYSRILINAGMAICFATKMTLLSHAHGPDVIGMRIGVWLLSFFVMHLFLMYVPPPRFLSPVIERVKKGIRMHTITQLSTKFYEYQLSEVVMRHKEPQQIMALTLFASTLKGDEDFMNMAHFRLRDLRLPGPHVADMAMCHDVKVGLSPFQASVTSHFETALMMLPNGAVFCVLQESGLPIEFVQDMLYNWRLRVRERGLRYGWTTVTPHWRSPPERGSVIRNLFASLMGPEAMIIASTNPALMGKYIDEFVQSNTSGGFKQSSHAIFHQIMTQGPEALSVFNRNELVKVYATTLGDLLLSMCVDAIDLVTQIGPRGKPINFHRLAAHDGRWRTRDLVSRSIVLMVENFHYADDLSRAVLKELSIVCKNLPIVCVFHSSESYAMGANAGTSTNEGASAQPSKPSRFSNFPINLVPPESRARTLLMQIPKVPSSSISVPVVSFSDIRGAIMTCPWCLTSKKMFLHGLMIHTDQEECLQSFVNEVEHYFSENMLAFEVLRIASVIGRTAPLVVLKRVATTYLIDRYLSSNKDSRPASPRAGTAGVDEVSDPDSSGDELFNRPGDTQEKVDSNILFERILNQMWKFLYIKGKEKGVYDNEYNHGEVMYEDNGILLEYAFYNQVIQMALYESVPIEELELLHETIAEAAIVENAETDVHDLQPLILFHLNRAGPSADPSVFVSVQYNVAQTLRRVGLDSAALDTMRAREAILLSHPEFKTIGDSSREAEDFFYCQLLCDAGEDIETAYKIAQAVPIECLTPAEKVGWFLIRADAARMLGKHQECMDNCAQVMQLAQWLGWRPRRLQLSRAHLMLGMCFAGEDAVQAQHHFNQGLRLCELLSTPESMKTEAQLCHAYAELLVAAPGDNVDYNYAGKLFRRAVELFKVLYMVPDVIVTTLSYVRDALLTRGLLEEARDNLLSFLGEIEWRGYLGMKSEVLVILSDIALLLNDQETFSFVITSLLSLVPQSKYSLSLLSFREGIPLECWPHLPLSLSLSLTQRSRL